MPGTLEIKGVLLCFQSFLCAKHLFFKQKSLLFKELLKIFKDFCRKFKDFSRTWYFFKDFSRPVRTRMYNTENL